jgi:hypothetical protein
LVPTGRIFVSQAFGPYGFNTQLDSHSIIHATDNCDLIDDAAWVQGPMFLFGSTTTVEAQLLVNRAFGHTEGDGEEAMENCLPSAPCMEG